MVGCNRTPEDGQSGAKLKGEGARKASDVAGPSGSGDVASPRYPIAESALLVLMMAIALAMILCMTAGLAPVQGSTLASTSCIVPSPSNSEAVVPIGSCQSTDAPVSSSLVQHHIKKAAKAVPKEDEEKEDELMVHFGSKAVPKEDEVKEDELMIHAGNKAPPQERQPHSQPRTPEAATERSAPGTPWAYSGKLDAHEVPQHSPMRQQLMSLMQTLKESTQAAAAKSFVVAADGMRHMQAGTSTAGTFLWTTFCLGVIVFLVVVLGSFAGVWRWPFGNLMTSPLVTDRSDVSERCRQCWPGRQPVKAPAQDTSLTSSAFKVSPPPTQQRASSATSHASFPGDLFVPMSQPMRGSQEGLGSHPVADNNRPRKLTAAETLCADLVVPPANACWLLLPAIPLKYDSTLDNPHGEPIFRIIGVGGPLVLASALGPQVFGLCRESSDSRELLLYRNSNTFFGTLKPAPVNSETERYQVETQSGWTMSIIANKQLTHWSVFDEMGQILAMVNPPDTASSWGENVFSTQNRRRMLQVGPGNDAALIILSILGVEWLEQQTWHGGLPGGH